MFFLSSVTLYWVVFEAVNAIIIVERSHRLHIFGRFYDNCPLYVYCEKWSLNEKTNVCVVTVFFCLFVFFLGGGVVHIEMFSSH